VIFDLFSKKRGQNKRENPDNGYAIIFFELDQQKGTPVNFGGSKTGLESRNNVKSEIKQNRRNKFNCRTHKSHHAPEGSSAV